jgi:hypothetical protein
MKTFQKSFLQSLVLIGTIVSEEVIYIYLYIGQSEELPVVAMFLFDQNEMKNFYIEPSKHQRRLFLFAYWPFRNKNCLCCHVFLSNQYEIMIFRKGPFKQNSCFQFANINKIVSYKSILFILANQKQELLNLNWPIDEKGGD